jgi:hypothetical protein
LPLSGTLPRTRGRLPRLWFLRSRDPITLKKTAPGSCRSGKASAAVAPSARYLLGRRLARGRGRGPGISLEIENAEFRVLAGILSMSFGVVVIAIGAYKFKVR